MLLPLLAVLAASPLAQSPNPNQDDAAEVSAIGTMPTDGTPLTLPLWPEGPPGKPPAGLATPTPVQTSDGHMRGIAQPTLTVHLPERNARNGAAVLVIPGGGYGVVAAGHEGDAIAAWLNENGIAAGVLRYRHAPYRHPTPLADARRGLRMLRAAGEAWGIDPVRVGALGFSAGGHLTATLATEDGKGDPEAEDALQRIDARPAFCVLVYPVITMTGKAAHHGSRRNLLGDVSDEAADRWSVQRNVTAATPATFLVHAANDPVKIANSELYAAALEQAGVPFEFARYAKGGHGFGLGSNGPCADWPQRCITWLRSGGWLDEGSTGR